jgi:hypothetical protein
MQLLNPAEGLYRRTAVASWSITENDQDEREWVLRRGDVGAEVM